MTELLSHHLKETVSATTTTPDSPVVNEPLKTTKEETLAKARMVFGSRWDPNKPGDRRRELDAASRQIAGVLVPPRPQEPDNCCMSGCVSCVWDQYRDEIEDWAAKSAEARGKLEAQRAKPSTATKSSADMPTHVTSSMDDDGGGSDTNWIGSGGALGKDLFDDIPVGIREFMKAEKRLKEKHARAGKSS